MYGADPAIQTLPASNLTLDENGVFSGTFNGYLADLGSSPNWTVSFQFGFDTSNYEFETDSKELSEIGGFTAAMPQDLGHNVVYYYRAKASDGMQTVYGEELGFRTPSIFDTTPGMDRLLYCIPFLMIIAGGAVFFFGLARRRFSNTQSLLLAGSVTCLVGFILLPVMIWAISF